MLAPKKLIAVLFLSLGLSAAVRAGPDLGMLLSAIRNVGSEGKGHKDAKNAVGELLRFGNTEDLIPILQTMDGADIRAINWLRLAGDALVDNALSKGGTLPAAKLEAFVLDTKHDGKARRSAYEWLLRVDSKAEDRLVPKFLNDPAPELRRDAIALEIKKAQALAEKEPAAAVKQYLATFELARDSDQVQKIAAALAKLDHSVNLIAHFGIIDKWQLLAPFDNTEMKGFAVAYPPENGVDLAAKLKGKKDVEIGWIEHKVPPAAKPTDPDEIGIVDLNKAMGKQKSVVGYAVTYVESPKEQLIEVRVGSWNAIKVFLNGKQVVAIEEYHHGMKMDQYVGTGALKKGRNEILVKVCQNEETDPTSQNWMFQLRLCDAVGGAVPFEVVTGKKEGKVQQ